MRLPTPLALRIVSLPATAPPGAAAPASAMLIVPASPLTSASRSLRATRPASTCFAVRSTAKGTAGRSGCRKAAVGQSPRASTFAEALASAEKSLGARP